MTGWEIFARPALSSLQILENGFPSLIFRMTTELIELLTDRIKQAIRLNEINDFADKLASCYQQGEITESEYVNLLNLHKEHLKIVLDLNLLPERKSIDAHLKNQFPQGVVKIDPAEIIPEEFQIIEQEAMRLNRARLEYIQDNFGLNSDAVSSRKKVSPPNNLLRKMLTLLSSWFRSKISP